MQNFDQYFIARKQATHNGILNIEELRNKLKKAPDKHWLNFDYMVSTLPLLPSPKIFKEKQDFLTPIELTQEKINFCSKALSISGIDNGKLNYYLILLATHAVDSNKIGHVKEMINEIISYFKKYTSTTDNDSIFQKDNGLSILIKYSIKFKLYMANRTEIEMILKKFLKSKKANYVCVALNCCYQIKKIDKSFLDFIDKNEISQHLISQTKLCKDDAITKDYWYALDITLYNLLNLKTEELNKERCVALINAAKQSKKIDRIIILEKAMTIAKDFGLNEEKEILLEMLPETVEQTKFPRIEIPLSSFNDKAQKFLTGFSNQTIKFQYDTLIKNFYMLFSNSLNALKRQEDSIILKLISHQYFDQSGRLVGTYKSDDIHYYFDGISLFYKFNYPLFNKELKMFLTNPKYPEFIKKIYESYEVDDATNFTLFNLGVDEYLNQNMISSLNILVPNFESSFRNIIKQAGLLTIKLKQKSKDINQEFFSISSLIRQPEVKRFFKDTHFLELISFIFSDEVGFNIRNNVAHGFLKLSEFDDFKCCLTIIMYLLMFNLTMKPDN